MVIGRTGGAQMIIRRSATDLYRGFALVELLVATLVLGLVFLVFLLVFSTSYTHSLQTRNRMVATILINTLLEEVEAHPYGSKPTANWGANVFETPADVWIEGRRVDMKFRQTFSYLNGSFAGVGNLTESSDVVNVTV